MNNNNKQSAHSKLIRKIQEVFPMNEEELRIFSERITVKNYKKGEILMTEGQTIDRVFFVIEGLVREFSLNDGKDRSIFFYLENQMVRLLGKNKSPEKSSHYLECLEDSTICVAYSRPDDEAFIRKYPRFETLCLILTEEIFKQSQNILEDYIHLSPLERYQTLLEKRPELVQRVPQQYLASYLGYTAESLSRIKKRLLKKITKN